MRLQTKSNERKGLEMSYQRVIFTHVNPYLALAYRLRGVGFGSAIQPPA
jgi:hypothetical protein